MILKKIKREKKNTLIIEPLAGLGNRMQTLASAYHYCKKYDKKLVILWNNDQDLGADFYDLFQKTQEVKVLKVTTDSYKKKPFLRLKSEVLRIYYKKACRFVTEVDEWDDFDEKELRSWLDIRISMSDTIYIKSWKQFIDYNLMDFSLFLPSDFVKRHGEKVFSNINGDTIGIHIRRTDHQYAIMNSPVDLFISLMQGEIENNKEISFFLATDDRNVERELIRKFKKKVIVNCEAKKERNSLGGMVDACVDMYALSKCAKIYGSCGSTFSKIAALWGQTLYFEVK